jgi:hypothetical protein
VALHGHLDAGGGVGGAGHQHLAVRLHGHGLRVVLAAAHRGERGAGEAGVRAAGRAAHRDGEGLALAQGLRAEPGAAFHADGGGQ